MTSTTITSSPPPILPSKLYCFVALPSSPPKFVRPLHLAFRTSPPTDQETTNHPNTTYFGCLSFPRPCRPIIAQPHPLPLANDHTTEVETLTAIRLAESGIRLRLELGTHSEWICNFRGNVCQTRHACSSIYMNETSAGRPLSGRVANNYFIK